MHVIRFYVLLLPSLLIYVVPISLLLATLYCLSNLTKNNELTAMRASGVSLYRLMLPFMVVGLFFSLTVAVVNETIAPWSAYWTEQYVKSQRAKGEFDIYQASHLAYKNEKQHRIWMINSFNTKTYDMENVEVVQQRDDGSDEIRLQAKQGRWLDGCWWFIDLVEQKYNARGHPVGPPTFEREREMRFLTETPSTFMNEIKEPKFLCARELSGFLANHAHLSKDTVARLRADLHHRLAIPWTCFIVMLLGIPAGVQTGRRGALTGIAISLTLFFSYYVLLHVGLWLSKTYLITPWLMNWGPNLMFLVLGGYLIYRMR